jgi:hypothetical protein
MQGLSAIPSGLPELAAPPDRTLHVDTGLLSPALIGRVAPAVTRTWRSRRSERCYVGRRPHDTEVYIVTATEVEPLEHPRYQSSAAFDWGDLTAGALELAFAMLAHTTDSRPPDPICLIFRTEVVARLDRAGFVLGDGDIALWLLTAFLADDASDDAPPPGGSRSVRRRAVRWFRSRLRRR